MSYVPVRDENGKVVGEIFVILEEDEDFDKPLLRLIKERLLAFARRRIRKIRKFFKPRQ